jgi:hypothetical protein
MLCVLRHPFTHRLRTRWVLRTMENQSARRPCDPGLQQRRMRVQQLLAFRISLFFAPFPWNVDIPCCTILGKQLDRVRAMMPNSEFSGGQVLRRSTRCSACSGTCLFVGLIRTGCCVR